MREPYSQVLMARSFLKGKKVQDWARGCVLVLDQEIEKGTSFNNERLSPMHGTQLKADFTRCL